MEVVKILMSRIGTIVAGVNATVQPNDDTATQLIVAVGVVIGLAIDVFVEKRRSRGHGPN